MEDVTLPRNQNGRPKSFGFVTFKHECSAAYAKELFKDTELFGKQILIKPKRDAPEICEVVGLNPLRGFGGDVALKGRFDLYSPSAKVYEPQSKRGSLGSSGSVLGEPDFDMLLKMGTQLQSPIGSTLMMGCGFGSPLMMPNFALNSPLMYPSQALDPIMNKHGENSNNHRNNDRSHNHRDRNRDRDHYDKPHPYRDNRRDDRRQGGFHSRNQSSSHRRERK